MIFAHNARPGHPRGFGAAAHPPQGGRRRGRKITTSRGVFLGHLGYRPGESKQQFLARHGAGPGPADPEKVPYYLLIVGDPEAIPFRFQYQLDVQYAVGRIHFESAAEYASYAESVVRAETGPDRPPDRDVFRGPQPGGQGDAVECRPARRPLAAGLADVSSGWSVRTILGDEATKARLAALLGGEETPAFLFTAGHGMGFPRAMRDSSITRARLLCQDWPGPVAWRDEIPVDFYFSGADIGADARVHGLIQFAFACYGAGTPAG